MEVSENIKRSSPKDLNREDLIFRALSKMDILYSKTEQLIAEFKRNPHTDEVIISTTELFREMRNVCSVMYANMDYQCGIVYYADGAILQNVIDIISNIPILNPQTEHLEKCFAVGMQLIGNLVVGNIKNQEIILMKYSFFLRNMFAYEGAKNYIYMIYYNCYFGSPHLEQLIISHTEAMTELTNSNLNSEFAEFFIELFLDRCQYFDHFYESVDIPKRPCLLNIIRQRYLADREKKFSSSFVTFLQSKFKSYNQDSLLKSFKSRTQTTAKEAAAVLDLLSNFSSDENYLKAYQQDFALFQHTVDLFLTIHFVDIKPNSGFHEVFSKCGTDGFKLGLNSFFGNVQKNPAYLFKVNLVRLISNLAWHNPNLDNKQVETKSLIPALIDCCRIDACNPFISEWAVFAIRNLRENHINNQRIIEVLRRQGTISKQMMKQMNKNIATSNYRFCVPGYKEVADNGLPIELLDMSQSERKRYLRAYFSSGEPDLSPNNSYSSDSSSGTESKKKSKSRRKRRKPQIGRAHV